MIEKYICMRADCRFVTDDEPEAIEHFEMEYGHDVIGVLLDDGRPICHPIGIRADGFDELVEELEEL